MLPLLARLIARAALLSDVHAGYQAKTRQLDE